MDVLVVSKNKNKLREIQQILGRKVEGISLRVKEDRKTFEKNALKKAFAGFKKYRNCFVIADDSGLMVDSLNGRPGVYSARYASPPTSENLCNKLLKEMKNKKNRKAKFVCIIALILPSGRKKIFKGVCKGKIAHNMFGENGFGYDPVFIPQGFKKTFGQLSSKTKNRLSHRGKALKKLAFYMHRMGM